MSQLQGARVIVATANRTVTGSVLTVEGRHSQIDSNKPPVTTHRLVIASDGGELTAFDLGDVRSVQLADEGSRRDLSEFAHAAASARRRDAKTIVVTSDGAGEREMVVTYTIAAPIWKTTYRVLLDTTGKPFFQGWAIVDNVSEEDWNGVELSLVSGTPVSFIQPIQNPVYRYRPVVPLEDDLNLKPLLLTLLRLLARPQTTIAFASASPRIKNWSFPSSSATSSATSTSLRPSLKVCSSSLSHGSI